MELNDQIIEYLEIGACLIKSNRYTKIKPEHAEALWREHRTEVLKHWSARHKNVVPFGARIWDGTPQHSIAGLDERAINNINAIELRVAIYRRK